MSGTASTPSTLDLSKGAKGTLTFGEESDADRDHRHKQEDRENRWQHVYNCMGVVLLVLILGFSVSILVQDKDNRGAWAVMSGVLGASAGYLAGRKGSK